MRHGIPLRANGRWNTLGESQRRPTGLQEALRIWGGARMWKGGWATGIRPRPRCTLNGGFPSGASRRKKQVLQHLTYCNHLTSSANTESRRQGKGLAQDGPFQAWGPAGTSHSISTEGQRITESLKPGKPQTCRSVQLPGGSASTHPVSQDESHYSAPASPLSHQKENVFICFL